MRLPKKISFLGATWEYRGAHLRDKLPEILKQLRRFPSLTADTAVVVTCYRVVAGGNSQDAIPWEAWKASRKK